MHPFFYLVDKTACRDTHQRLALDALLHLRCRHSQRWQRLLLRYYRDFLDGARAPDVRFRDYENHVLHVREQGWGGASIAARQWYEHTVEAIAHRAWRNAAYSAGVLSHYLTDPLHPLQTQFARPGCDVQHAFEWSTAKAYRRIRPLWNVPLERVEITLPTGGPWLREALWQGAENAQSYAAPLVQQYDFRSSLTWPVGALNDSCRTALGKLIRHASGLFAAVLSRALDEVDELPPLVHLHGEAAVAVLKTPVRWSRRVADDLQHRWQVWSMLDEWERLGSVQHRWPAEQRAIAEAVRRPDYGQTLDYVEDDPPVQAAARQAEEPTVDGDFNVSLTAAKNENGWDIRSETRELSEPSDKALNAGETDASGHRAKGTSKLTKRLPRLPRLNQLKRQSQRLLAQSGRPRRADAAASTIDTANDSTGKPSSESAAGDQVSTRETLQLEGRRRRKRRDVDSNVERQEGEQTSPRGFRRAA